MKNANKELNKKEFIRNLAERSGFTIGDIKVVWKCVEEIFEDAIRNQIVLNLRGLGKLYFTKVKKRKGYNAIADEYENFPETKRVSFRIAENLRDLLK